MGPSALVQEKESPRFFGDIWGDRRNLRARLILCISWRTLCCFSIFANEKIVSGRSQSHEETDESLLI